MKQYERFAEHMTRLLDERGISTTELARAVGFKSRNSLYRILNDQTSSDVEQSFFNDLKASGCLKLTPCEWARLEESLEISRLGVDTYVSHRAIRELLSAPPPEAGMFICFMRGADGSVQQKPLYAVLKKLTRSASLKLTMFNCCNAGFIRTLADELRAAAKRCQVSVTHYFFAGKGEVVRNMMATQSILYEDWYNAYMMTPDSCPQETEALLRANTVLIHLQDAQGNESFEQLVMLDKQHIIFSGMLDQQLVSMLDGVVKDCMPQMHSVKSNFADIAHDAQDYLRYTDQYRMLEHNCAIMSLKPDVPINYIHPDILLSPVLDGFTQSNMTEEQDMHQLVSALYNVQLKRFNNFFKKKKVTHTIFSAKAMERFVRTGKQSDHFFAIRPYTPAERKAILLNLRDQAAHNPYFWVYFLKNDEAEMQAEITLYEGKGVMFMQADTSYDLESSHNEALVNHPELNETFKDFFMKDMLTSHVLSYQDTMALLDHFIQMLG